MSATRRLRFQIYADVLRAIHSTVRIGNGVTLYRVERITGLTHTRLRNCLGELRQIGFVDDANHVSDRGYAFLGDMSNKVAPVLRKYGLWPGEF